MYIRRISFITSNQISQAELTAPGALAQLLPAVAANPSDNLRNWFEIPVLFCALAIYLYVTNQVDALYVNTAWVFVVFRALHSAVHCTFNVIMFRFYLYLAATVAVWFIAIRAALTHFGAWRATVIDTHAPAFPRDRFEKRLATARKAFSLRCSGSPTR
jgi:hypothetical protein